MPKKAGKKKKKVISSPDASDGTGEPSVPELLAELESKRILLYEFRSTCEKLRRENEVLFEELRKHERDSIEVSDMMRQEAQSKDDTISQLQAQLQEEREQNLQARAELQAQHDEAIVKMKLELQSRDDTIAALTKQLKTLESFASKQGELTAEIERLSGALAETQNQHMAELSALDAKHYNDKSRLMQEHDRELAAKQKLAEEELAMRLDESTKRILAENAQMAKALALHVRETGSLSHAKQEYDSLARTMRMELQLRQEALEQMTQRLHKQGKENRDLQQRVAELEAALSKMITDFNAEKSRLRAQVKRDLDEARVESSGLRRLLDIKTRELNYIKRLAQALLDQRTDVETFLLDSLELVRKEMSMGQPTRGRDRSEQKSAGGTAAVLPALTTSASMGSLTGAAASGGIRDRLRRFGTGTTPVDASDASVAAMAALRIEDMTWADRERVLRILLSRINQAPKTPLARSSDPLPQRTVLGAIAPQTMPASPPASSSRQPLQPLQRPSSQPQPQPQPQPPPPMLTGTEMAALAGALSGGERPGLE